MWPQAKDAALTGDRGTASPEPRRACDPADILVLSDRCSLWTSGLQEGEGMNLSYFKPPSLGLKK